MNAKHSGSAIFSEGRWIWTPLGECDDQYIEFYDKFRYTGNGKVYISLSADSNYSLKINGLHVASGQYCDYEHYKIYDTLEITEYVSEGDNELIILAYHAGTDSSRYRRAAAGLIYEVRCEGSVIAVSGVHTLSRISPYYESGRCVKVSPQLGYTFFYDSCGDPTLEYQSSEVISKPTAFYERPIPHSVLKAEVSPKNVTRISGKHYLIDLGGEYLGLPCLRFFTATKQKLTVAWGEHIKDGGVRKTIAHRSFYFEYTARVGYNRFTERLLRIGCRYLEIFAEEDIDLEYAGVMPEEYPTERREVLIADELDRRIYEVCRRTLEICMMDHYVDCPWREQALYACDSRNQMLCGYYAFKGGNADYVRSNLTLIGKDTRSDGFLSICYPCGVNKAIPSFSLHYILAVGEYIEHTADVSLAAELYPKLCSVIDEFLKERNGVLPTRRTSGLIWNFYDWSEYSDGGLGAAEEGLSDCVLSSLLVLALSAFGEIAGKAGMPDPYSQFAAPIRTAIRDRFFTDKGMFTMLDGEEQYTVLANSLALLAGVLRGDEARAVADRIVNAEMKECSLSMKLSEYLALLSVDAERYRNFILTDIRRNYKAMLDEGSDTVWETVRGADDFSGAGSLCHGWSAIPIYFYHILGIAKYPEYERT